MFIDLHSHSISSDDSRATVEQFVKWVGVLRKKGFSIDGFVLTEHRKFDADKDYSNLAEQYSVKIFKGSNYFDFFRFFKYRFKTFSRNRVIIYVNNFNQSLFYYFETIFKKQKLI